MKCIFTFAATVLLALSAHAGVLSECKNYNVMGTESELVYHTATPGISVMPRSDMSLMVMAYDVTMTPREGMGYFRWGNLNENGEGHGLWTKWRDYDKPYTFTTPGIYVLEANAQAPGKDISATLYFSFKVDYLGMTMAPGIILTPVGERGYYMSLWSPYDADIYYRWKHYDSDTWSKWRLYTEDVPFTEAGKYVVEARCEDDPLSAYIVVPSVDYYLTGDVDYNGTLNVNDVSALIDMLLNPEIMIGTGDVNQDGVINMGDVITLIDMLLNND